MRPSLAKVFHLAVVVPFSVLASEWVSSHHVSSFFSGKTFNIFDLCLFRLFRVRLLQRQCCINLPENFHLLDVVFEDVCMCLCANEKFMMQTQWVYVSVCVSVCVALSFAILLLSVFYTFYHGRFIVFLSCLGLVLL